MMKSKCCHKNCIYLNLISLKMTIRCLSFISLMRMSNGRKMISEWSLKRKGKIHSETTKISKTKNQFISKIYKYLPLCLLFRSPKKHSRPISKYKTCWFTKRPLQLVSQLVWIRFVRIGRLSRSWWVIWGRAGISRELFRGHRRIR